ncbi:MAG: hypothetical protein HFJ53_01645 [Clostridia bacterium]|nr:hypothetical protein [Clostridia bacterium]
MEDRYMKFKFERVINRILYVEGVIDEKKYKRVSKKLDKLLFEESKKKFTSTLI